MLSITLKQKEKRHNNEWLMALPKPFTSYYAQPKETGSEKPGLPGLWNQTSPTAIQN